MAAAEFSEMQDTDPIPLELYPRDREVVLSRATDGEEEMRCNPARSLSLPLRFLGGSWSDGPDIVGLADASTTEACPAPKFAASAIGSIGKAATSYSESA